ncbi:TetR/AcrR family transcriptional regulator [Cellulomonas sp. S1-8]|uniref:TetR/AcrR family transcriptional regulator n=1 Tax=Cellulomonas sp. S1-8 TaxID=2904790 RepID=UPI002244A163|nr:TetR/AcrR family transcriptional regulator [Cellulomonas sp. S1-8]UZN03648.1 TetR/AcrR family transcriptional regulator [Cellulomonas sp. S1-8]
MSETVRARIIDAALRLLDDGGPEAMSTRAVSAAAGVQAPTLYRLFRDKQGLLDAVTEHRFDEYLADKTDRPRAENPVEDLRRGFDLHVGFGLANPAVYVAVYGGAPRPDGPAPAVLRAEQVLLAMMRRVAAAGRLRVDETTAAHVLHAAGRGTTLLLISTPPDERDLRLPEIAREAVIAAITTAAPAASGGSAAPGEPAAEPLAVAARTIRAALPDVGALSPAEKDLLAEWLDRLTPP